MVTLTIDAPEHVPPELVVPFDQLNGPEVMSFPPMAAVGIGAEKPVFYSSFYGGFWVFTRYEDIRAIYQNPDVFIQWSQGFPANPFSKLYKPVTLNFRQRIRSIPRLHRCVVEIKHDLYGSFITYRP